MNKSPELKVLTWPPYAPDLNLHNGAFVRRAGQKATLQDCW